MAAKNEDVGLGSVTLDRAQRLYRLVKLLGLGPQTRSAITRKLRLAVRGFYRDLEILRTVGVRVKLQDGRYHLEGDALAILESLPFPDPGLTLGEARLVARGRASVHRKIRTLLEKIEK